MEHNQDTESGTNSSSRSVGKNSSHDVVTDFKNSQIDSNHSQLGHGNSSKVLSKQSVLSSQSSKPLAQNIQQTPSKKKSSHQSIISTGHSNGNQNDLSDKASHISQTIPTFQVSEDEIEDHSSKPLAQNIPQTPSKKKSSHQSIISTGHSNGNQNHLSAKSKASHISQTIPTFQVSEPNSSSQSVSEKISAYLSNQNIVQQSESFNESRASSLKLNTENKSVSLGSNSICFSAVSASEVGGNATRSKVKEKSQRGVVKSSLSIPKVASFQQKSFTALKPSNCNLDDLMALSQQIVVSPNTCIEKINIARSRQRLPPDSVERREGKSASFTGLKSETGKLSSASLSKSKSSLSSKRSLSQKISDLLTRRSSNSGLSSKASSSRSSEKDKLSKSRTSVLSGMGGIESRHSFSAVGVVETKSLSGKISSLDQTEIIGNAVSRGEPAVGDKSESHTELSITPKSSKCNSVQQSLKTLSKSSNCQSKLSHQESKEKCIKGASEERLPSKSTVLSTSHSSLNAEFRESISLATSERPSIRSVAASPPSKMKSCQSIDKCSKTSFQRNCEPHLISDHSGDQLRHDNEARFVPDFNSSHRSNDGSHRNRSYETSTSSCSHDIGSEDRIGNDFHPPVRNSLSNLDQWLADRNNYLDKILNRINKLESDSSAHLHRHQTSESSNDDKFNKTLRIIRHQGRLIKDLENNLKAHQSVISFVQEQSLSSHQSIHEIGYLVKELYIYFKRLAESSSANNKKFSQDIKDVCFTVYAVKKQLDALRSSIQDHSVSL
ncbi:hypothetical protein ACHWQZ_G017445 [Mnemiopsis leidyi]